MYSRLRAPEQSLPRMNVASHDGKFCTVLESGGGTPTDTRILSERKRPKSGSVSEKKVVLKFVNF